METDLGSIRRRTILGSSWVLAGRFMRLPVTILATAILARLLAPADFGVIAFVTTLTALAATVLDGSIAVQLVRQPRLAGDEIGTSMLVSVVAGFLLMGIALAAAVPLERWLELPRLGAILSAIALTLPLNALAAICRALLQRQNDFRSLATAMLLGQIAYAVAAILFASMGFGVWSLVYGLIGATVVEGGLNLFSARHLLEWRIRWKLLHRIIADSSAFTLAKILGWGSAGFDKLVAAQLGATPLGYYSRANAFFIIASQSVGAGLTRTLLSSFAAISADPRRLAHGYVRALEAILFISIIVAANTILFAPHLVRILLGPGWVETVLPLRILMVAFVARSTGCVAEALMSAIASNRHQIARQALKFVLVAAFIATGLSFGVVGIAAGFAAAAWVYYIVELFAVRRRTALGMGALARAHARPLALNTPPFFAALVFTQLSDTGSPLISLTVGGLVYLGALLATVELIPARLLSTDVAEALKLVHSKSASGASAALRRTGGRAR